MQPQWLISHWWGSPVAEFIACIEQHHRDYQLADDTPLWCCAYSNNQWKLQVPIEGLESWTSYLVPSLARSSRMS